MALQKVIFTYTIMDDLGLRKSLDVYAYYEDTTATLSTLVTYMQASETLLDAMTDGAIVAAGMKVFPALVAGLKTDAVEGSDIEEAGLITYNLSGTPLRAYSEEIPAIAQAVLVGKNINYASGSGQNWTNHQLNGALAAHPFDDRWSSGFVSVRAAQKKFRKSRRALSRA